MNVPRTLNQGSQCWFRLVGSGVRSGGVVDPSWFPFCFWSAPKSLSHHFHDMTPVHSLDHVKPVFADL